jgi:hypothetical protein
MTKVISVDDPAIVQMAGKKVGKWTVLGEPIRAPKRAVSWLCECECGSLRHVGGEKLRQCATHSCGCITRKDMTSVEQDGWVYKCPVRDLEGNYKWAVYRKGAPSVIYVLNEKPLSELKPSSMPLDWKEVGECGIERQEENVRGRRWKVCSNLKGKIFVSSSTGNMVVVKDESCLSKAVDYCKPEKDRSKSLEIVGQTVGSWKVLEKKGRNKYGQAEWVCECVHCHRMRGMSVVYLERGIMCPTCKKKFKHSDAVVPGGRYGSYVAMMKVVKKYRWTCRCAYCSRQVDIETYRLLGGYPSCSCKKACKEFWDTKADGTPH